MSLKAFGTIAILTVLSLLQGDSHSQESDDVEMQEDEDDYDEDEDDDENNGGEC